MESLHHVDLRVVATESVRPHEIPDPAREARIGTRLREDGILRDPVIVGAVPDLVGYVLLDGTNRQRALAAMALPRIMVQVIDYSDQNAVQLRTWCHAVRLPMTSLLDAVANIPGLHPEELAPLEASERLAQADTLAVLLERQQRIVLCRDPSAHTSRVDQLRSLVGSYESSMVRVDCQPGEVEERAHLLATSGSPPVLVAFPAFARSQVVTMSLHGLRIPAGITRHVILGGRALRVNLPLSALADSLLDDEADARLAEHLAGLQPRQYREPTILYDS